jgi:hypothetical protein
MNLLIIFGETYKYYVYKQVILSIIIYATSLSKPHIFLGNNSHNKNHKFPKLRMSGAIPPLPCMPSYFCMEITLPVLSEITFSLGFQVRSSFLNKLRCMLISDFN